MLGCISFEEAIRKKLIMEGDQIYIPRELFPKSNERVALTTKETGWIESQFFEMEDLEWTFHYDEHGMPAFFGGATSRRIFLSGEVGYNNAIRSLNKICELYSNPELWDARTITMEEGEKLRNQCDYRDTWLGTKDFYIATNKSFEIHTMYYIDENRFVTIAPLFQNPIKHKFHKFLRIGPVLPIKASKILVETNGKKREGCRKIFQK